MDIIDLSTVATDDASFLDYIDQLCQKLGFDYASYATTSPMTGAVQGYANYPDSWKMHYMRRNLHRVDPTIHKSALSIAPVDWSRFERDERFRAVFFAAEDFGITPQGLTVPVRGPYGDRGLLSVTRNCARPEWEKHKRAVIGELQVAAVHLHDAVMRSDVISRALRQPRLSAREIEVLQWAAAGKSQTDIGDILGISHRTVEVHLRSAREKLGTLSTVQAVGRAIGLGLVYPR
ncbi:LuxR family transcriptional regulator [Cereibacter johrii]|uniref:LuxR family transcriptional regulator n=1 Tax=Cereibacter johrii TaxID=445629 RepID=A0ABX5JA97_9RHOB|nr:LuxR family transcriptional regulator [Cereibacter johrii]QCP85257.1 LuxR family transcriptional regulator [Cereibacter sphaeroides]RDS94407.1 LuxR family transcriptional regulator [Cereibacter sphaeroides f. sp. denitrificans]MEA5160911.1 LuxR family transcriptional regulator [Cereibacter johrii]ODM41593.1 LuxR family transcriptional regulator [Cereibacter johrii]PTM80371.1 LuxR family transcriptional regulator [Cereibacter johrii]